MVSDDPSSIGGLAMTISTMAHLIALAIALKYKFDRQRQPKMSLPPGFGPKGRAGFKKQKGF
jgi:hypothetical protein